MTKLWTSITAEQRHLGPWLAVVEREEGSWVMRVSTVMGIRQMRIHSNWAARTLLVYLSFYNWISHYLQPLHCIGFCQFSADKQCLMIFDNALQYSVCLYNICSVYIWAKCCMLANQTERMSRFLVTSSSCTGHTSCASAVIFNTWESTYLSPIWPNFMVLGGPGPDLWPLKLLP